MGIPLGGWRSCLATAAGLALGPAVALGLARFAYSLLLPALRSDRHWSFAQAGAMNTANAVGYLAGAIGAGPRVVRAGSRRTYLAGIGLTAPALPVISPRPCSSAGRFSPW
ncbi:MAG: YbfB/YjiJ family MFS transporter [Streptosporangiaceae bacterium]